MFKAMLKDWRRKALFVALAAGTVGILHVATSRLKDRE